MRRRKCRRGYDAGKIRFAAFSIRLCASHWPAPPVPAAQAGGCVCSAPATRALGAVGNELLGSRMRPFDRPSAEGPRLAPQAGAHPGRLSWSRQRARAFAWPLAVSVRKVWLNSDRPAPVNEQQRLVAGRPREVKADATGGGEQRREEQVRASPAQRSARRIAGSSAAAGLRRRPRSMKASAPCSTPTRRKGVCFRRRNAAPESRSATQRRSLRNARSLARVRLPAPGGAITATAALVE